MENKNTNETMKKETGETKKKSCDFYAYLDRMKFIRRWQLMRCTRDENIMEHSESVALFHARARRDQKQGVRRQRRRGQSRFICRISRDGGSDDGRPSYAREVL